MAKQKVNTKVYTQEVIKNISDRYKADATCIKQLAQELGVPDRSVMAKLIHLGVYVKKPYLTKRGTVPIPKLQYIESISKDLGIDMHILESLEKVTKQALVMIAEGIKENIAYATSLETK